MHFELSSRTTSAAAHSLRPIKRPIESILRDYFLLRSYGESVDTFIAVIVVMSWELGQPKSRTSYSPKQKMMVVERVIDHDAFRKASDDERLDMVIRTLLVAVRESHMCRRKPVGFDFAGLADDVERVVCKHGWLREG